MNGTQFVDQSESALAPVAVTSAPLPDILSLTRRHPLYYIDDGNTIIEVENTLFKVHHGFCITFFSNLTLVRYIGLCS